MNAYFHVSLFFASDYSFSFISKIKFILSRESRITSIALVGQDRILAALVGRTDMSSRWTLAATLDADGDVGRWHVGRSDQIVVAV